MNNSVISNKGNSLLCLIKGIFVAILISLVGILAFALVIKFFNISQNLIQPINQVIKFLSILIGVNSMFKNCTNRNLLLACLMGAVYTIVALIIFNLLNSSFNFDLSLLTDCLFGAIAGFISGVISKILMK